ncbi:AAA family ATPase [Sphingomonas naphthae]|uniref:AAA family ATPase n=1 Tax=Sphingomonas naphthae TaxID=1813468 RepID=A0ABY7TFZ9_9SPHN|nr:AAA family ATPase [Sphingomonas naphthae]WCT72079.1 AAA family ATPase [Sphingomonas naphthae]
MATLPVDINTEEARQWLLEHRKQTGKSWAELGILVDVPSGTLSPWGSGSYAAPGYKIAEKVERYRQKIDQIARIAAPTIPTWYDTPTAAKLDNLFAWAQRGRIVVIVGSPGISKTKSAEHYRDHGSNVWLVTVSHASASASTIASNVAYVVNSRMKKGSALGVGMAIKQRIMGTGGLLIFDEAHKLQERAIDEIRSWHDETGIGVVLMGNEEVVGRLEDGSKLALAQIKSRVSYVHVQREPLDDDLRALLDAWGITDEAMRAFIVTIGRKRGEGALRACTHVLEIASMTAFGAQQQLTLDHLKQAQALRLQTIGRR